MTVCKYIVQNIWHSVHRWPYWYQYRNILCGAILTRSLFSQNYPQRLHIIGPYWPIRARYGGSLVDPASDWYFASISVIIHVISYNIWPRYNGADSLFGVEVIGYGLFWNTNIFLEQSSFWFHSDTLKNTSILFAQASGIFVGKCGLTSGKISTYLRRSLFVTSFLLVPLQLNKLEAGTTWLPYADDSLHTALFNVKLFLAIAN